MRTVQIVIDGLADSWPFLLVALLVLNAIKLVRWMMREDGPRRCKVDHDSEFQRRGHDVEWSCESCGWQWEPENFGLTQPEFLHREEPGNADPGVVLTRAEMSERR